MLGDKINEELEYERYKELSEKFIAGANIALAMMNTAKKLNQPFYIVYLSNRRKSMFWEKVKNKEEAYNIIKREKAEKYIFCENIFREKI